MAYNDFRMDNQWLPFTPNRSFQKDPRIFVAADGMHFTTHDGKQVIDGISSLWCVGAGHNRKPINEAIKKQLDTLDYATAFSVSNDKAFRAAEMIAAMAPGDLNKVLFCNSGSEAADTSLKVALAYHRARGEGHRNLFIGRERGYHGVNFGGMSVGGIPANRKMYGSALLPRVDHLRFIHDPVNHAYIHNQEPVWNEDILLELENRLLPLHDASNVAAVIVEPIAGSAGWYIPPQGYLKRLREICDKHGILLIFDEVITGFGRLGTAFASDYYGVQPDMLNFAKAVTNGVFENNANTADATAIANRNGVSASLANIGSSTLLDDGIALSGVSVNTGATASVDATNSSADIGTTLIDFATGSVDVSNNTVSSGVVINEGSNTFALSITGSEPVGYTNLATTNAAVTTDLSGSATDVADLEGTLLVSSVQIANASADSTAETADSTTFVSISTTADADVTGTATLDGNDVTSTFTANARTASIGLAADDANTSVTAAISNAQSFDANSTDDAATARNNAVRADISGPGAVTTSFVDSSLSVASNTIAAAANGNTATTQIALADGLAYNTVAANAASGIILVFMGFTPP